MPEKKNLFSSDFKLGILGGGQLGKMLLTETRRYDIKTKVMDPSPVAPCRFGSNEFEVGSLTDRERVLEFASDCDLITIEIEGVNTEALHQLENEGKAVYPKPATLDIIKNKCRQKEFYRDYGIATADFISFVDRQHMDKELADSNLELPLVWKAASGGYDGRGVQIVEDQETLMTLPDQEGLLEKKMPFDKEIAVVTARSATGEIKSYPVVEMDFHPVANLVEFVFSPSVLPEEIQTKAIALAEDLVEKLDHVGLLAVEMFCMPDGEILVNEVAPRVHNSGHLTIEGHVTSQFDQHLRAILGLPLGSTETVLPAVMVNLTGEEGYTGPVVYDGIKEVMAIPGTAVHLYGKAETRPFRKMGHITITDKQLDEARSKARKVKDIIKVIST